MILLQILLAYLAPSRAFRGVTPCGGGVKVWRSTRWGWERVR
jgi:hypothetical protein